MTSLFRYETFYCLWVDRFFDIRRERQNLSILAFSSDPPTTTATNTSGTRHKGLREQVKANCLPPRQVSSQLTFFKFPKSSAPFWCVTSFALCNPVSYLGLLWHLCVTRPLCENARAGTPVLMLDLNNPCTDRKGSQPN